MEAVEGFSVTIRLEKNSYWPSCRGSARQNHVIPCNVTFWTFTVLKTDIQKIQLRSLEQSMFLY